VRDPGAGPGAGGLPAPAPSKGQGKGERWCGPGRWPLLLAAVLVLALLVRIAMLLSLRESVYRGFLWCDEQTYDRWGRALVAGKPFSIYSLSALPAYVVAGVYRLLGPDPLWVRLLNVGLGVGTCVWLFAIGRRLAGTAAGLAAALAGALYRPFVLLSATALKEPLGIFLFAWFVWLALAERDEHRPGRALLLGAAAGLLVNVRQNAVLALAVAAPWIAWELRRRTSSWRAPALALLVLGAGFAAATAPFALANLRGAGRLSPVPLGGFDLYRGNVLEGPTPYYNPVAFSSTNPDTQGVEFAIEASRRVGRTLTLAEASSYWSAQVAALAWRHPGAFARRLVDKALAAIHWWEEGDDHSLQFLEDHVPFLRVPMLGFWLVLPLGMAGLVVLALRRDRRAALLLAVVLAYGASMVLVFSNMRVRAPLLVVLIPCAIAGLRQAAAELRTRPARALGWAAAVLVFAGLEAIPVRGAGDLTAHFNTHASVLLAQGRRDDAREWWRRSSEARGTYSCIADLSLASLALEDGDRAGAWQALERVPEGSHASALKHALAGSLLLAEHRNAEAAAELEASLSRNSAQLGTLSQAIEAYATIDERRAAALASRLELLRRAFGPLADAPAPPPTGAGR
jgi:4-amino-4-deoxy-L-arabinose transferase-like glycosyltransferase